MEQTAGLAAVLGWLMFGLVAVPLIVGASWWSLLYACGCRKCDPLF